MQYVVKIDTLDRDKVEALHYQVEARANLLDRLASRAAAVENSSDVFNRYMGEYEAYFREYSRFKTELELKYKPEEIAATARSWQINFDTAEMIFEVEE